GVVALLVVVCQYVYTQVTGASAERWQQYQDGVDRLARRIIALLPVAPPEGEAFRVRDLLGPDSKANALIRRVVHTALSEVFGLLTTCFVVLIYFLFLLGERAALPARVRRAFAEPRADAVLAVVANINRAIAQYISVKTFVSFLQGFLSFLVLALFGVDF